nr:hypothetical protein [Arthrobacter sp. SDTb3-6]
MEAVQSRFGTSTDRRAKLWDDFLTATALLRSHVPVCAVWMGGSYFTIKPEPDDIDCVFLVEASAAESAINESAAVIGAFASGKSVRRGLGLELDTFILPWAPDATTGMSHPFVRDYYRTRGYWDDLWSKMRSGSKGATPVKLDSHPRRGYLEVILDGYPEIGPFYAD